MKFTLTELGKSWFNTLKLDQLRLEERRIPDSPSWKCAINKESNCLFTQFISSPIEMRDGFYYYLLAIGDDLVLISRSYEGKIIDIGNHGKYSIDFLMSTVNDAYGVYPYDNMPIFSIRQLMKRKNIVIPLQD